MHDFEVSVLMTIYHKESPEFLFNSLKSIELQELKPKEVVFVEDGPISIELSNIIEDFRISLNIVSLRLPENRGRSVALNEGLKKCSCEFVAIMDTDDYSVKNRLLVQSKYLIANPDVTLVGSFVEERDDKLNTILCLKEFPLDSISLKKYAKLRSPVAHPSVMFRKSAVEIVGGYPLMIPEDYSLCILLMHMGFKIENIPEVLVIMRAGDAMISRRKTNLLPGIIVCYKMMLDFGMMNKFEFYKNCFLQYVLRNTPHLLLRLIYRRAR